MQKIHNLWFFVGVILGTCVGFFQHAKLLAAVTNQPNSPLLDAPHISQPTERLRKRRLYHEQADAVFFDEEEREALRQLGDESGAGEEEEDGEDLVEDSDEEQFSALDPEEEGEQEQLEQQQQQPSEPGTAVEADASVQSTSQQLQQQAPPQQQNQNQQNQEAVQQTSPPVQPSSQPEIVKEGGAQDRPKSVVVSSPELQQRLAFEQMEQLNLIEKYRERGVESPPKRRRNRKRGIDGTNVVIRTPYKSNRYLLRNVIRTLTHEQVMERTSKVDIPPNFL